MKLENIQVPDDVCSISLRFLDMDGGIREIIIPKDMLDIAAQDGVGFDSSNLGYSDVSQSDMVVKPDISTFRLIQDEDESIAIFMCHLYWPDGKPFMGDPRRMLKNTLDVCEKEGIIFHIKPEYEFFILDRETFEPIDGAGYIEGSSLASRITNKIALEIFKLNIPIQKVHHEVGNGQYEIEPRPYEDVLKSADDYALIKEVVKKTAEEHETIATFMAKPLQSEPGSGMHVHITMIKDGKFVTSEKMKHFIGGLLNHAKGLSAICCPSVNSYKRLVPGFEAPVYIAWGGDNRSVLVRIPSYGNIEEEKGRAEFRAGDASGNFYLMLNSLLVAGMAGLKEGIDPGHHVEQDLFDMDMEDIKKLGIDILPSNLGEALDSLEKDPVVVESLGELYPYYLNHKKKEWRRYKEAVTDWEFEEYLDC